MTNLQPIEIDLGNGAPPGLDDQIIARFTHTATLPAHARVGIAADLALALDAHFIGITAERLVQIRRQQAESVTTAAAELLQENDFRKNFEALPFHPGDRLVVVGDSITADSLSWAHLLRATLEQAGHQQVTLINLAVSASTTSELIAMFDLVVRAHPTWVLQLIGTNDARHHGPRAGARAVSLEETRRNLLALERLVRLETTARFVPITPPPMNHTLLDEFLPADSDTRWLPGDVDTVIDVTRACLPSAIDLGAALTGVAGSAFWIADGLHPSLQGHQAILRCIVQDLAAAPARR
jgi:lysophospholipase L1-like esterase